MFWAPNSNQIITYFSENQIYILDANKTNKSTELINSAFQLESLLAEWQQQLWLEQQTKIEKLPEEMKLIATQSATLTFFSPNEEKLLYVATQSASIPNTLIPPVLASNSQPEHRDISPNNLYIYDTEEDKNFLIRENIFTPEEIEKIINKFKLEKTNKVETTPVSGVSSNLSKNQKIKIPIINQLQSIVIHYSPIYTSKIPQWFPTSNHLVFIENDKITISEYDNTNSTHIYSGPFINSFTYPWPNGDKMIILTSLTLDNTQPTNLYGLNLK